MLRAIRQLYWRLKYRRGRKLSFCFARDGFTDVLIVENRLASTGTVVYRTRGWCPFMSNGRDDDVGEYDPPREDTIPDMIRYCRTSPTLREEP